jgi:hypothetical protein
MKERIGQLERLLEAAREERDRYEKAIRWALGYTVGRRALRESSPGEGAFWWRRKLTALSGVGR